MLPKYPGLSAIAFPRQAEINRAQESKFQQSNDKSPLAQFQLKPAHFGLL